jgi:uncharacterized membrane protein YccC
MLAALFTILAQNSQRPPEDDGLGIGLILLGVLIAALIAFGIFTVFTKGTKRRRGTAPGDDPHRPGHVGH